MSKEKTKLEYEPNFDGLELKINADFTTMEIVIIGAVFAVLLMILKGVGIL